MYRQAVVQFSNGADMGRILLTLLGYWYGAQLWYTHTRTPFNISLLNEQCSFTKNLASCTFPHWLYKNQVEYLWIIFLGRSMLVLLRDGFTKVWVWTQFQFNTICWDNLCQHNNNIDIPNIEVFHTCYMLHNVNIMK